MINNINFNYKPTPILPLVYDDTLTYIEVLGKVQLKMNELIELVNSIDIPSVRQELAQLKTYVDTSIANNKTYVDNAVAEDKAFVVNKVNELIEDVNEAIAENKEWTKQYVGNELAQFKESLIGLGDVLMEDFTSGTLLPIPKVLKKMMNLIMNSIDLNGSSVPSFELLNDLSPFDYYSPTITQFDVYEFTCDDIEYNLTMSAINWDTHWYYHYNNSVN